MEVSAKIKKYRRQDMTILVPTLQPNFIWKEY